MTGNDCIIETVRTARLLVEAGSDNLSIGDAMLCVGEGDDCFSQRTHVASNLTSLASYDKILIAADACRRVCV